MSLWAAVPVCGSWGWGQRHPGFPRHPSNQVIPYLSIQPKLALGTWWHQVLLDITPVIRSLHLPTDLKLALCRYKDDLFFRLTEREDGSCDVFGHSHSTVSFDTIIFLNMIFLIKIKIRARLITTSQQTTATCATWWLALAWPTSADTGWQWWSWW